ncbi:MAG: hypothetical protein FWG84_06495 [Bacteroidales bacterium]|nr:hypothetical protein [Bacteroidales bacterium]
MDTIVKRKQIFSKVNSKELIGNDLRLIQKVRMVPSSVFFKKGEYRELVDDPFNLKK